MQGHGAGSKLHRCGAIGFWALERLLYGDYVYWPLQNGYGGCDSIEIGSDLLLATVLPWGHLGSATWSETRTESTSCFLTLSVDLLCGIAKLQSSQFVAANLTCPLSVKLCVGAPRDWRRHARSQS